MRKEITFIYQDSAEKALYQPIIEEAERRGYQTKLTDNKFERCQIGIYCQHINFPQYSKFSVIMLHDIIQQYSNWPDIWFNEPWHKYDIGFLPSELWVENWTKSSSNYYTRPRKGVFKAGWPKGDRLIGLDLQAYRKSFNHKHGLDDHKRTILYAPAWENDGKQDDFVQAMLTLDVNILIKQYDASPELFPDEYRCIQEMYELHKNNSRVTILEPSTNIYDAILASDILVSEESSTMCEAVMAGIPAVSVSNWLIPDVTPSRYPKCDYDFVTKTEKEQLGTCIAHMLQNYDEYQKQTIEHRDRIFGKVCNSSKMMLDIIDDCIENNSIRYVGLTPNRKKIISLRQFCRFEYGQFRREVACNYAEQYNAFKRVYSILRHIKRTALNYIHH